jgi:P-type E1-E2 ATPase
VGAASARGILIRDVAVLETFRRVRVIVLDKTGTVTEGRFRVRGGSMARLDLAAALEAYSGHPLARALVEHAREQGIVPGTAEAIEVHDGMGMAGTVQGLRVAVGSRRLMAAEGVAIAADLAAQAERWAGEGLTVAYAAAAGAALGCLAFGDQLRAEARPLVQSLRAMGMRVVLLSGDTRAATARIGAALGVDEALGEVLPGEKAEAVRRYQAGGAVVAMVGDGVNDAPALAVADLGIAMGSGADLAQHAAPIVLLGDGLMRIDATFRLARRTVRVVRQNLFWAFVYNAVGIPLAMAGVLNPILAAGAMVLSSLSVIGNSLRLGRRDQ